VIRAYSLLRHPEGPPSRREGGRLEGWAAGTSADIMVRDAALAERERGSSP